jgi:hypothetical protein
MKIRAVNTNLFYILVVAYKPECTLKSLFFTYYVTSNTDLVILLKYTLTQSCIHEVLITIYRYTEDM